MGQQAKEKGTIKLLLDVFLNPVKKFVISLKKYFLTSIAILLCQKLESEDENYFSDVEYAFFTFELVLIILFGSKLIELGKNIGEFYELVRDFSALILFFLLLLVTIGIGRLWKWILKIDATNRQVDAGFMNEFNFLLLPAYVVLYPVYTLYEDNDDVLDLASGLFLIVWGIHLVFYFLKFCKELKLSILKTIITLLFLPFIKVLLLFFSTAMLVGASVPD